MDGSSPLLLMSANALWGHPSKLRFEGTKTHLGILSGIVSLLWHSKQASSTTQWRCRILYLWRNDRGPQHTPQSRNLLNTTNVFSTITIIARGRGVRVPFLPADKQHGNPMRESTNALHLCLGFINHTLVCQRFSRKRYQNEKSSRCFKYRNIAGNNEHNDSSLYGTLRPCSRAFSGPKIVTI